MPKNDLNKETPSSHSSSKLIINLPDDQMDAEDEMKKHEYIPKNKQKQNYNMFDTKNNKNFTFPDLD